jgi:endonuclease YncB( thermonuclease family)
MSRDPYKSAATALKRDPAPSDHSVNGKVWTFAGQIERVIDGDTVVVKLLIDTGHDETLTRTRTIRILGINAPEKATPEGKAARAYAQFIWMRGAHDGRRREGGQIRRPRRRQCAFAKALRLGGGHAQAGHAVPYDGGKR